MTRQAMTSIRYPTTVYLETCPSVALSLVDAGTLRYAAHSAPVEYSDNPDVDVIRCHADRAHGGDVLLSLIIDCDGLKAVEFSVFGVVLHSSYFVTPHVGAYEVRVPVCMLNTEDNDVRLVVAKARGLRLSGISATYISVCHAERTRMVSEQPDGSGMLTNMLDVALHNGIKVAQGFFKQDAGVGTREDASLIQHSAS